MVNLLLNDDRIRFIVNVTGNIIDIVQAKARKNLNARNEIKSLNYNLNWQNIKVISGVDFPFNNANGMGILNVCVCKMHFNAKNRSFNYSKCV